MYFYVLWKNGVSSEISFIFGFLNYKYTYILKYRSQYWPQNCVLVGIYSQYNIFNCKKGLHGSLSNQVSNALMDKPHFIIIQTYFSVSLNIQNHLLQLFYCALQGCKSLAKKQILSIWKPISHYNSEITSLTQIWPKVISKWAVWSSAVLMFLQH